MSMDEFSDLIDDATGRYVLLRVDDDDPSEVVIKRAARRFSGSVLAAKAGDDVAGASRVNSFGGTENCVACSIAGDTTLRGNRASALVTGRSPFRC